MVTLHHIPFGSVFCAPGALGFFGEGYTFHRIQRLLFGDIWSGVTFAAKTVTGEPRTGNLPLGRDKISPIEWLPQSICVKFGSGHVLNGVGLSNPGIAFLLAQNRWQQRTRPFMLSWAAVGQTPAAREWEITLLTQLTRWYQRAFQTPFAIQLNCGCPNTGQADAPSVTEIGRWLQIAAVLGVPLLVNVSVVTPVPVLLQLAELPGCDALWIANTIPWGDPCINWQRLFGSTVSPLIRRGLNEPGGLSGPACLPFVIDRVSQCRQNGLKLPIVAGNGIQTAADAQRVMAAGADGIALGVVGLLRPWRLPRIISTVP